MNAPSSNRRTVLVTGVAGNLGQRLLPHLADFDVIGVDMAESSPAGVLAYERIDLGEESSCAALVSLLRKWDCSAVVHLAFVIDPLRTGVLDVPRMWRINVAGTARVMEAITEVNRSGGSVQRFIFPSSVSAYGPETPGPVREEHPLGAHTLPYAIHKQESDEVVQSRASSLGACHTTILRPHIFSGASMQNYLVGALRGTPTGKGRFAEWLRQRGFRLPIVVPFGQKYRSNLVQFVHVDDMARLMAFILRQPVPPAGLTILNVAGRGEALSFEECAKIAGQRMIRLPGRWSCRLILSLLWKMGVSGIPPDALPFILGSYTMDVSRLQRFLGAEHVRVIRYTVQEALADSFAKS
jgi:nucleoside-diphosphate-sugar epimerase